MINKIELLLYQAFQQIHRSRAPRAGGSGTPAVPVAGAVVLGTVVGVRTGMSWTGQQPKQEKLISFSILPSS